MQRDRKGGGFLLDWFIARRYLSARRGGRFLSFITWISLGGVTVGVTALICVHAFILFEPAAGGVMSSRSQHIAVAVMGLVMVGLHLLIPWYPARRKTA